MKSTVNFKCTWSTDTKLISRESEEHIYKKIGRLKGNVQKLVGMMIDHHEFKVGENEVEFVFYREL